MRKSICLLLFFATLKCFAAEDKHLVLKDTIDSVSAKGRAVHIQEIQIKGRLNDANITSGSTGLDIDVSDLKLLPKLVGECDPYKALQYMGGVSQAGEASSGLYVRGGNNDQNLILLNGSMIQNPTHVLGMFSVFNPDLISQMRFVKSGMPAEYGGRLSSVVDISTSNAIPEKLEIKGSIGLISSRISFQLPINEKFSVYGSWRGSYISSIILPALQLAGIDSLFTGNRYEYWDLNAGFIYKPSKQTRLTGHFYKGMDDLKVGEIGKYSIRSNSTGWTNTAGGLQLNHVFSDNLSMNHQVTFSGFRLSSILDWYNSQVNLHTQLDNLSYKGSFFYSSGHHHIKAGTEISYNNAVPNFVRADSISPLDVNPEHNDFNTVLASFYVRDEWNWNKWQVNAGLRGNIYSQLGPYVDFQDNGNVSYPRNDIVKTYSGFEPRFFFRYLIDKQSSIKFSATRHMQFLNQIAVMSFGIPADLQMPASLYVKPQTSWHFSTGYFRNLAENAWELGVEVYYKTLANQLEFKNGMETTFANGMFEKNLLIGKGCTYGTEWKISKNLGAFTGWLSYNLAWSYRQFDQINNGKPFLATNDRRHDLSLIGMYKLNDRWNFSAVFVYATGNRLNLPLSWFIIDNKVIFEYENFNAFRMPSYHRLDISANHRLKPWHGIQSELNFSVYNVYNRANPFQLFYSTKTSADNKYNYQLKMTYLLPVIPSVSWTFNL